MGMVSAWCFYAFGRIGNANQVVEVTGTKSYGEPRVLIEVEEVR